MCGIPVHPAFARILSRSVAISLVLVVLGMVPFAGALEIHHVFADLDRDGHEHSDFDLCQWVQHHSSGSLVIDTPVFGALLGIGFDHGPYVQGLFCIHPAQAPSPRAPPSTPYSIS